MIQDWIAESYAEMPGGPPAHAARGVEDGPAHAAGKHYSDARVEIGVIKFWGAKVLYNVIDRAIQIHGVARLHDRPAARVACTATPRAARIYDGPDEVHKVTVARQVLKGYRAATCRPSTSRPVAGRARRSSPSTST